MKRRPADTWPRPSRQGSAPETRGADSPIASLRHAAAVLYIVSRLLVWGFRRTGIHYLFLPFKSARKILCNLATETLQEIHFCTGRRRENEVMRRVSRKELDPSIHIFGLRRDGHCLYGSTPERVKLSSFLSSAD